MFERILLPLDGTGDWEYLLPHLDRLAVSPGSEVVVLEAVPFLETLLELPQALGESSGGADGDNVPERHVAAVVAHLQAHHINARGMTQIGSDAGAVTSVARRLQSTSVILALRQSGGFLHDLHRATTRRSLEGCSIPIYVVPLRGSGSLAPLPVAFRRVVVPLDGAPTSLEIIPAAASICRRFAAPMLFLHVAPADPAAWRAGGIFQAALLRADREGIPAETLLAKGDPATEIVRTCRELEGSLIAMRTSLRSDQRAGPLGDVTLEVLRKTTAPMLIVRKKKGS